MITNKSTIAALVVVGIGLLVISLFADVLGIGNSSGFGNRQIIGAVAGVIIAAAGLFFKLKQS